MPFGAGGGGDVAQGGVGFPLQNVNFINGGPGAQRLDHRVAPLDDAVGLGLRDALGGRFRQTLGTSCFADR